MFRLTDGRTIGVVLVPSMPSDAVLSMHEAAGAGTATSSVMPALVVWGAGVKDPEGKPTGTGFGVESLIMLNEEEASELNRLLVTAIKTAKKMVPIIDEEYMRVANRQRRNKEVSGDGDSIGGHDPFDSFLGPDSKPADTFDSDG